MLEFCAREASQIFGGLSYTRGGQGEKVERLYREVRAFAIPGGSEEIMLDLGVRHSSTLRRITCSDHPHPHFHSPFSFSSLTRLCRSARPSSRTLSG